MVRQSYNETMSSDLQIRVLIRVNDPQLRDRAAAALDAGSFRINTKVANSPSGNDWQVIVTDQAVDEHFDRGRAGRGSSAIVGLGVTENVDVDLPVDFTGRELRIAVRLVRQMAELRAERDELVEAHSAVRQLAETDPLTGLPNRRAWERRIPALLALAARTAEPAWLALLDLDGFKQINDHLGMNRGDQVLRQCALSLSSALRRDDLVARLGGDEFGILLVGVGEDRVLEICERLRDSIANGGEVSASIGLTRADGRASEAALLSAAEVAMREAKRAGGNRVTLRN